MSPDPSLHNFRWGWCIAEELFRCGIEQVFFSPGARSTPLIAAVARHPGLKSIVSYDERGAAFLALGYGRACGKPAVVICTSGTAAAHYYPAIIEASLDHIPLIVLTADRPPELRDTGANQTMRQPGLYGDYVRWQFDLPCPDPAIPLEMVLTTVDHLVGKAGGNPPGPVHLNCMFREPLLPAPEQIPRLTAELGADLPSRYTDQKRPYTDYANVPEQSGIRDPHVPAGEIRAVERGLLVIGTLPAAADRNPLNLLAERLGWPVYADITSGCRRDGHLPGQVPYFDLLLMSETIQKMVRPEYVLHLGGRLVSKRWWEWLDSVSPRIYVHIDTFPDRLDPLHRVSSRRQADPLVAAGQLADCLGKQSLTARRQLTELAQKSDIISRVIQSVCEDGLVAGEISVGVEVFRQSLPGQGIFLASSMPVRDADMFSPLVAHEVKIGANRAVSGIDGTLASAAGFAVGLQAPVTLVTGDLAFLHDLNSLQLLPSLGVPVIVVLLNNRGGGIFSFLPLAEHQDIFESHFGTPHSLSFREAAGLFNLTYYQPDTNATFVKQYRRALKRAEPALIEIFTDRQENADLHRRIYRQIVDRLN